MRVYIYIILSLFLISCQNSTKTKKYSLVETSKKIILPLDNDIKNELFMYSIYEKEDGNFYFIFQNINSNILLFYDLEKQKLEFRLELPIDGNNGVGLANGYYIHNFDSIYVPNRDIKEISLINKEGIISTKYAYDEDINKINLSLFDFSSAYYKPAEVIGRTMYLYSGPNRFIEHDPVSIIFDMDTHEIIALPFDYPDYPGSDLKLKKYGLESTFSRCYNGEYFIYSFAYDENIYIANLKHDSVQKIPVKSDYFKEVKLPDELTASPIDFCTNSWYGNLLYDKYRNVYYRIAYPQNEIEKNIRPTELICYGRKNFSIIILDEKFNKIGETKFPNYTYNPRVMFILEDGLYISDSHYLNPKFSDDELSFKIFKLTEYTE